MWLPLECAIALRSYIMVNSIRSLTFAAILSLAVVPTLSAENMGTNPKPKTAAALPSVLEVFQATAFLVLGL